MATDRDRGYCRGHGLAARVVRPNTECLALQENPVQLRFHWLPLVECRDLHRGVDLLSQDADPADFPLADLLRDHIAFVPLTGVLEVLLDLRIAVIAVGDPNEYWPHAYGWGERFHRP